MIEVTFTDGKIGRRTGIGPQFFSTKRGGSDLPEAMFQFVRKHLASREVEIITRADGTGEIIVGGYRVVGTFAWKEREHG